MGIRKSGDANLWPFGVIPFEINAQNFPEGSPDRAEIFKGIEILNTRTNLTLVERSGEEDYVEFVFSENACQSRVGRGRGRQQVSCAIDLDGFNAERSVVHECLHAAGFYHEHQRENRGDFVFVDRDNVKEDRWGPDYDRIPIADADDLGEYDIGSVMHYPRRGRAAIDSTKDIITPIDPAINPNRLGGARLSNADVEFISTVYPFQSVPGWFGAASKGADIAVGAIKSTTSTDLVVAWATAGRERDSLYYRVGWGMDGAARPQQGWSDRIDVPKLVDPDPANPDFNLHVVEGVGVALADINANGKLDLIIAYLGYGVEVGGWRGRKAFYRIGFDLDSRTGKPTNGWSADRIEIPGLTPPDPWQIPTPFVDPPVNADPLVWDNVIAGVGDVGLALADIDANGQMDVVFFYVLPFRGSDRGFYRVGFDLDAAGAANRWSEEFPIPAPLDARTNGAGLAVADVRNTMRQNLLMYQVANPNGPNKGYLWIGPDMEPTGKPVSEADPTGAIVEAPWSPRIPLPGLLGPRSQGGGLAVAELDGRRRLLYFFLDNPVPGQNRGVYRAVPWDPAKPWTTGTTGTSDRADIIEFLIVPDAVAPDTVEFKLELGPNINWHKGIWVPTDVVGGGTWIEAHDDVRAKSTITVPSAVLGAGLSLRFQKAMFLGVITDLAGSTPLSSFSSLTAGSQITFTWVEDGGFRPFE